MENSMLAAAIPYDDSLSLPGLYFGPSEEEIIEFYLLPSVRGQPDLFPLSKIIIDDDSAANTRPWELFHRHGLSSDLPAFFFVCTKNAKPDARPERICHGGGFWKSQKSKERGNMLVLQNGEKISWKRNNLNFHMDKKSRSLGWVMHEYTIPKCSSLRFCQISFSGHGQKRMRSPNDSLAADEPVPQRLRVAHYESGSSSASASTSSWMASTLFDPGFNAMQTSHQDQEPNTHDNGSSDEEIQVVAELTNAQQPNWEFQDQAQTMEQPNQDPSAFLAVEEMTEFDNSLAKFQANGEHYELQHQQLDEQVPMQQMDEQVLSFEEMYNSFAELLPTNGELNQDSANDSAVIDPFASFLSVEGMTGLGNCFAEFQADEEPYQQEQQLNEEVPMQQLDEQVQNTCDQTTVTPSFSGTQSTDGLFTTTEDEPYQHKQQFHEQVPMQQFNSLLFEKMHNCFAGVPANGETYQHQQQFDEQVHQHKVDQDAVMPSFGGAQDTQSTSTEDVVEWGGFHFC